jgi:hypothetical protein
MTFDSCSKPSEEFMSWFEAGKLRLRTGKGVLAGSTEVGWDVLLTQRRAVSQGSLKTTPGVWWCEI